MEADAAADPDAWASSSRPEALLLLPVRQWYDVVAATRTVRALRRLRETVAAARLISGHSRVYREYLLEPDELWARA